MSTFKVMFQGKSELFHGFEAKHWTEEHKDNKRFVLHLDLNTLKYFDDKKDLNSLLIDCLDKIAFDYNIDIKHSDKVDKHLRNIIREAYKQFGQIFVLIDGYDNPILDSIASQEKTTYVRSVLSSFYAMLKSCDKYIYFLFVTGTLRTLNIGVFFISQ